MTDPGVFPRAPRPGAEGLAEPMRSRWSPRLFDPAHQLADDDLRLLLEAARWAPSWGNSQPCRWIVCRRGTATFEHLLATLTRGNAGWVPRVSVVLVPVVQTEDVEGHEASPYALYDAGQASAHVTLQARAMGLHAHQFAGFDREDFAARMGVPHSHRVVVGVAVGAPGDPDSVQDGDRRVFEKDLKPRTRRPLREQAFEEAWERPWSGAPEEDA